MASQTIVDVKGGFGFYGASGRVCTRGGFRNIITLRDLSGRAGFIGKYLLRMRQRNSIPIWANLPCVGAICIII